MLWKNIKPRCENTPKKIGVHYVTVAHLGAVCSRPPTNIVKFERNPLHHPTIHALCARCSSLVYIFSVFGAKPKEDLDHVNVNRNGNYTQLLGEPT
jgi:hypothetical protein